MTIFLMLYLTLGTTYCHPELAVSLIPLWIKLVAIIITFFILKTAYDIFYESSLVFRWLDDRLLGTTKRPLWKFPNQQG